MTHKDETFSFKGAASGSGATSGTFKLDATKPDSGMVLAVFKREK